MTRLLLLATLAQAPAAWAQVALSTVSASVLDAQGRPVEDAVVFLHDMKGKAFAPPDEPAVMDQIDKEFAPHLLPVQVGTRVRFPNRDNIHHHIFSYSEAKPFDLPLYKGEPAQPVLLDKPGVVKLGCNIHDWMSGVILILPNPHFAITDGQGRAKLAVPAQASVELAVFHERLKGPVDKTRKAVTLKAGAGEASWKLTLKPPRPSSRPALDYK